MKNLGLGLIALVFVSTFGASSFGYEEVSANCVGGPEHPSYAFWSLEEAQQCAERVGSFSEACKKDVRSSPCVAPRRNVDAIPAGECVCGGEAPAIGNWE